jgi:hypothetical protein
MNGAVVRRSEFAPVFGVFIQPVQQRLGQRWLILEPPFGARSLIDWRAGWLHRNGGLRGFGGTGEIAQFLNFDGNVVRGLFNYFGYRSG